MWLKPDKKESQGVNLGCTGLEAKSGTARYLGSPISEEAGNEDAVKKIQSQAHDLLATGAYLIKIFPQTLNPKLGSL